MKQLPIATLLGVLLLGCSAGSSPSASVPAGGSAGQVSAAGGGAGVMAAASGMATGGTPTDAAGAAGTAGASGAAGNGGAAGSGGAAGGGSGGAAGSGGAQDDGWVPLFNGMNLDGWMVHGTSEPLYVVENGEIHVYPTQQDQSDQPLANLRSLTKLGGKYTLHVEYKWGEARFSDRKQTERDAGILFHLTGDVNKVWPDSIECQIGSSPVGGEWVTGDLWVLGDPTVAAVKDQNGQLIKVGEGDGFGSFRTSVHAEHAHGEWNSVDVIVNGSVDAVYMLNDVKVNHIYDMGYGDQPLSEGFISVQAEFAELFYRNIRYKLND